jgi:hypothetical protein
VDGASGNIRGNIQNVDFVQFVQIRARDGRSGRIGRIWQVGDEVEGLVRDNRVEVRVLFGASRITCSARRFRFSGEAGRVAIQGGGNAHGKHRVAQVVGGRARQRFFV